VRRFSVLLPGASPNQNTRIAGSLPANYAGPTAVSLKTAQCRTLQTFPQGVGAFTPENDMII
jgi:hypothetical protein